ERIVERCQAEGNMGWGGTVPHQADPEDPACQRAESRADLDVESLQQVLAHARLVDAVRHADGIEGPQALAFGHEHRDAARVQALDELVVMALVPRPPRIEPLFV